MTSSQSCKECGSVKVHNPECSLYKPPLLSSLSTNLWVLSFLAVFVLIVYLLAHGVNLVAEAVLPKETYRLLGYLLVFCFLAWYLKKVFDHIDWQISKLRGSLIKANDRLDAVSERLSTLEREMKESQGHFQHE